VEADHGGDRSELQAYREIVSVSLENWYKKMVAVVQDKENMIIFSNGSEKNLLSMLLSMLLRLGTSYRGPWNVSLDGQELVPLELRGEPCAILRLDLAQNDLDSCGPGRGLALASHPRHFDCVRSPPPSPPALSCLIESDSWIFVQI
jgi:hypothetical protein